MTAVCPNCGCLVIPRPDLTVNYRPQYPITFEDGDPTTDKIRGYITLQFCSDDCIKEYDKNLYFLSGSYGNSQQQLCTLCGDHMRRICTCEYCKDKFCPSCIEGHEDRCQTV